MNDITDKITDQDMDDVTGHMIDDRADDAFEQPTDSFEEYIELDEDDLAYRNRLLRSKQRGILTVAMILVLATMFPLWFLQHQEKASNTLLWGVAAVIVLLMLVAGGCYVMFTRQIKRDLQSNKNLVVLAYVVEGWQTNERRDPLLRINMGGYMVDLSANVLRRHVENVTDVEQLMPGARLLVEMTPHARVIVRIVCL